jgi:leucyl-tRNA synthetase
MYEMFIGDFEKAAPWSTNSVRGCRKFIERFWNLQEMVTGEDFIRPELEKEFHKTIKKVGNDIENIKFNTAIAALMALINSIYATGKVTKKELAIFAVLLNPFAPHVTEEVWEACSLGKGIIAESSWPEYDEAKCVDDTIEIVAQVNGKIKAKLTIAADAAQDEVLAMAKSEPKVAEAVEGKNIVKEIYIKGRLVNIVVK